jgi:hypothetical protein
MGDPTSSYTTTNVKVMQSLGGEDIDTAESGKNTSSFVKKQISKQPRKKMKKHDVASLIQRSMEQHEQRAKESTTERKS